MLILLTKDGATKVAREVSTPEQLDAAFATGCHIELSLGDGNAQPLTREEAGAVLALESAGKPQTEETQAASKAEEPAKKVRVKDPAKTAAKKR